MAVDWSWAMISHVVDACLRLDRMSDNPEDAATIQRPACREREIYEEMHVRDHDSAVVSEVHFRWPKMDIHMPLNEIGTLFPTGITGRHYSS